MLSKTQVFVILENSVVFGTKVNTSLAGKDVFVGELESPSGQRVPCCY